MPYKRPTGDTKGAAAWGGEYGMGAASMEEHSMRFRSFHAPDKRGEITVRFRPIRAEDEQLLRDFFASHSEETIYLRYGMMLGEMTHERALGLVELDGHDNFALIGLVDDDGRDNVSGEAGERIIAVARYCVDGEAPAEVAFVVHEAYRGLGIAKHLLYCLTTIIHEKGFSGITAQVIDGNRPMLQVMNEVLGPPCRSSYSCGERTLHWRLDNPGFDIKALPAGSLNAAGTGRSRWADTRTS